MSSRTQTDRKFALERMRAVGAHITTTESVVLTMVGDSSHPQFKLIQKLIKDVNEETGLSESKL